MADIEQEEGDLRSELSAAFDKVETSQEPAAAAPEAPVEAAPAAEEAPPAEAKGDRPRDESGRFLKKTDAPVEAKEAPKPADPAIPAPTNSPIGVPQPVPEQPAIKPPQSWKPAAREKWATVPSDIQQEVYRREQETTRVLQETAEARQGYQRFKEMLTPYEPIMRSLGADPYQATNSALQGLAVLASGPAPMKAQLIANLVRQYGVDIQALDAALSGQPVQESPQNAAMDPNYVIQRAKQELRNELEQVRQQSFTAKAQEALKSIEAKEFFSDVREEMADILTAAANRGVAMTPEEAYNRAVWVNPHTAEVMQQRRDAQLAANANASTQRARAAASSVKPSPAVPQGSGGGDDLRSIIEAAWDRAR